MLTRRHSLPSLIFLLLWLVGRTEMAVQVLPVEAAHGMVVAGHPQAAQAGLARLQAGGNAVDAAVAVSLALGVAEPYGSGLGGKMLLLYYEAASGRTWAIDAMDEAGALNVDAYLRRPEKDRGYGYGSVCVPGLAAGLWMAHEKWGRLPWADNVAPAIKLAREGFEILPKTRDFFAEHEEKLRQGDAEIARLYLPQGGLPAVGTRLANPDLARTMEFLASRGRDGFYRGPVAEAIVTAGRAQGGVVSLADFAGYEARLVEPIGLDFRGHRLLSAPPPTAGAAQFLTIMKVLEHESFAGGPLRTAANLDLIGRVWQQVQPLVQRDIADAPAARFNYERLVSPASINAIRARLQASEKPAREVAWADVSGFDPSPLAATTHFIVVDKTGNIVCATQSLSLHFGAGVVPPGTGVLLNNSMNNFSYGTAGGINYVAPHKRPRSTIAPTVVLKEGRPVLAIGIPGSTRIPTALLQALLDRLALDRPVAEAIGDTRVHFDRNWRTGEESLDVENSFPSADAAVLKERGWKVRLAEPAGTGRIFGGINAVEIKPEGGYIGYADPRRTNAAAGY